MGGGQWYLLRQGNLLGLLGSVATPSIQLVFVVVVLIFNPEGHIRYSRI
jgi:hypothetical protein